MDCKDVKPALVICFRQGAAPERARHPPNAGLMFAHRLRLWPNIKPALGWFSAVFPARRIRFHSSWWSQLECRVESCSKDSSVSDSDCSSSSSSSSSSNSNISSSSCRCNSSNSSRQTSGSWSNCCNNTWRKFKVAKFLFQQSGSFSCERHLEFPSIHQVAPNSAVGDLCRVQRLCPWSVWLLYGTLIYNYYILIIFWWIIYSPRIRLTLLYGHSHNKL